jgi:hypothetical protein
VVCSARKVLEIVSALDDCANNSLRSVVEAPEAWWPAGAVPPALADSGGR